MYVPWGNDNESQHRCHFVFHLSFHLVLYISFDLISHLSFHLILHLSKILIHRSRTQTLYFYLKLFRKMIVNKFFKIIKKNSKNHEREHEC